MEYPFWKMHGAGNDFVLFDDRTNWFPVSDSELIARLAKRRTGVGSEGVILIQRSQKADFRMRFFNPDGREMGMCGNGARCVAQLAHEIGAAPASEMTIETQSGILHAERRGREICLSMPRAKAWRLDQTLKIEERVIAYNFVNTGVEHVVVESPHLEDIDLFKIGRAIRYHHTFAPEGSNVNFVEIVDTQRLKVRTYERGVEDETLACGTGVVASALVAAKQGWAKLPLEVECAGGAILQVEARLTPNGACGITLTGPATYVFKGEWPAEKLESGPRSNPKSES